MPHPYLLFLAGLAGTAFLSACSMAVLAVRGGRRDAAVLAALSVSILVYIVCDIRLYLTVSAAEYLGIVQVQMFGTAGFSLSMLGLSTVIAGVRPAPTLVPFGAAYAFFAAARLVRPGFLYGPVAGISQFVTPWGERLAMIQATFNVFGQLYALVFMAAAAVSIVHLARKISRGANHAATVALLSVAVIVLTSINDVLVSDGVIPSIFLAETGFVAFVSLMGILVTDQATTARRLASALEESERRLGAVFNSTYEFMGILDPEGRLISANAPALRFAGATLEEVKGRVAWETPWWRGLPQEQESVKRGVQSAAAGSFVRTRTLHRAPDDSVRTFDFSLTPVRGPAGVDFLIAEGRDISELAEAHRQLEAARDALAASQSELTSILVNTPDIIYRLDAGGRITFVNDAVRPYGYEPRQMIGRSILDFVHPDDRGLAVHRLDERRTGPRKTTGLEIRLFSREGETRIVEYTTSPLYREPVFLVQAEGLYEGPRPGAEHFIGTQGIARDITERKRAEEALQERGRFIEAILESAPVGYAAHRISDRSKAFVSRRYEEICGLAPGSIEGYEMFWEKVFQDPAQREAVRAEVEADLESGDRSRLHWEGVPIRTASGELRFISAGAVLLPEQDLVVAMMQDVTPRFRAEEAQRRSESLYRLIAENTGDVVWVIDPQERRFTYVSPSVTRLLGCGPREAMSRGIEGPLEPADRRRLDLLIDQAAPMAARGPSVPSSQTCEIDLRREDGSLVPTEVTTTVVRNEQGRVEILGVSRDITDRRLAQAERKKLEEQLFHAQKIESIGTLASGIAHDFNNILNIIHGNVRLIESGPPDPSKLKSRIGSIAGATERGAHLVRQLLTFARKTEVKLQPIMLNELVTESTKLLEDTFPKTIEIRSEFRSGPIVVTADPNLLHQVLLNLSVNARDAMPGGGTLTVSTELEPLDEVRQRFPKASARRYATLRVRDTGHGMDEEVRRRAFDPFFTTKEPGKGTGLGLAVVMGVVENLNGVVDLESQPGRGTEFRVTLPAEELEKESADEARARIDLAPGGREAILVVEDEKSAREILVETLQVKGYTVLSARDGEEALRVLAQQPGGIALVLSDLGLPRIDGEELARRLRPAHPAVPIMILSGFVDPKKRAALELLQVTEIIQKPYDLAEVLVRVRRTLDRRA